MATTTPNRALPVKALADTANAFALNNDLAVALDAVVSIYSGTLSTRGAATSTAGTAKGCPGTLYYATDTNQLFLSLAGAWIDLSGSSAPPIPLGGLVEYSGAGDPSDARWLLSDGRAVSRTTYAGLFGAQGTAYGAGDGSTTFNLPDARGRVSVGVDNMGTAAGAAGRLPNSPNGRGNVGGEEKHLLTGAESGVAVHTHGNTFGIASETTDHVHHVFYDAIAVAAGGGQLVIQLALSPPGDGFVDSSGRSSSHSHALTGGVANSAAANASQSHNTMQPYVVLNKLIRVL